MKLKKLIKKKIKKIQINHAYLQKLATQIIKL